MAMDGLATITGWGHGKRTSPAKGGPTPERLLEFKITLKKACDESHKETALLTNRLAILDELLPNPSLDERAEKTLRKLINHKSPQIAVNALNLVEFLVKNCDHFVEWIARDPFLLAMKKNIPKKFYLQQVIQMKSHPDPTEAERIDKTLVLFQSFSKLEAYPKFKDYYEKLSAKGIKFPEASEDEQLIILPKSKSTDGKTSDRKDGKYETPSKPPPPPRRGSVGVKITDSECASLRDTANLLDATLTESNPSTRIQSDEVIQQLLVTVKQGMTTLGARLGRENSEILMAQLSQTFQELSDVQDYYQGLLSGKAVRTYEKGKRYGGKGGSGSVASTPQKPPTDLSKLSEKELMDLAMKQSIEQQKEEEKKRKEEQDAAEAKSRAEKEKKEKSKSPAVEKKAQASSASSDDFFGLLSFDPTPATTTTTTTTKAPASKPAAKPTSSGPLDLSFLDDPIPTTTSHTPHTTSGGGYLTSTATTASTATTKGGTTTTTRRRSSTEGNPFAEESSDEEPGQEGQPHKSKPKEGQTKQQDSDEEEDDPFLALATRKT